MYLKSCSILKFLKALVKKTFLREFFPMSDKTFTPVAKRRLSRSFHFSIKAQFGLEVDSALANSI